MIYLNIPIEKDSEDKDIFVEIASDVVFITQKGVPTSETDDNWYDLIAIRTEDVPRLIETLQQSLSLGEESSASPH